MTIFNFNNCFLIELYRQTKHNTMGWGHKNISGINVHSKWTPYSKPQPTPLSSYIHTKILCMIALKTKFPNFLSSFDSSNTIVCKCGRC